jgi:hypothetical protein
MAWLIHADGSTESVLIPEEDGLDVMQECVKGYIEVIPCGIERSEANYVYCVVNEEGILMNLNPNMVASKIMERPIVGPALFLEEGELS